MDQIFDHSIIQYTKKNFRTGIILLYQNLTEVLIGLSGKAKRFRASDLGAVHAKYNLMLHKKQDVMGSHGHLRNE